MYACIQFLNTTIIHCDLKKVDRRKLHLRYINLLFTNCASILKESICFAMMFFFPETHFGTRLLFIYGKFYRI